MRSAGSYSIADRLARTSATAEHGLFGPLKGHQEHSIELRALQSTWDKQAGSGYAAPSRRDLPEYAIIG